MQILDSAGADAQESEEQENGGEATQGKTEYAGVTVAVNINR